MSKTVVSVSFHPLSGYALTFDYNQRVVDAIKEHVPGNMRAYNPETHAWILYRREFVDSLRFVTRRYAEFELHLDTPPWREVG